MAGSDIAAGVVGALGGFLDGYGAVQQRKRQQQADEERRQQQQIENEARVRALALQEQQFAAKQADDLRQDYSAILGDAMPGARVRDLGIDPQMATRVGLGGRMQAPGAEVTEDPLGLQQMGLGVLPGQNADYTVAETAKQRATREAANTARHETAAQKYRTDTAVSSLPAHLQPAAKVGVATGKIPTFGADDFVAPDEKARLKFNEWKQQQDYASGLSKAEADYREGLIRSRPETGPGPTGGGRGLPAGNALKLADITGGLAEIDAIETELNATSSATGMSAAVGAWMPNAVTESIGIGRAAKERQAVIDRVKQIVGKALEGGVLRKEDEIKYTKILPTISDPPAVAAAKLKGLRAALQQQYQNDLESYADAGFDTSSYTARQRGAPTPAGAAARTSGPRKRIKGGGVAEYQDGVWVRVE